MARIELNKGWKIFGSVVLFLLSLVAIFCVVVAIMAHIDNLGFIEEIESWVETAPKDKETVTSCLNLLRLPIIS